MGFKLSKLVPKPLKKIGKKIEKVARPGLQGFAPAIIEGSMNAFVPGSGTLIGKPAATAYLASRAGAAVMPVSSPAGFDFSDFAGGIVGAIGSHLGGLVQPVHTGGPTRPATAVPYDGGAVQPTAAMSAGVSAAVLLVRALLKRASEFLGRRVTRASALEMIKKWGPTAAASALGWTVAETLQFWMATGGSRPRRRRGITYRQLSTARRVAGTLSSMTRQFQSACSSVGYSRPRRAPAKKRCR